MNRFRWIVASLSIFKQRRSGSILTPANDFDTREFYILMHRGRKWNSIWFNVGTLIEHCYSYKTSTHLQLYVQEVLSYYGLNDFLRPLENPKFWGFSKFSPHVYFEVANVFSFLITLNLPLNSGETPVFLAPRNCFRANRFLLHSRFFQHIFPILIWYNAHLVRYTSTNFALNRL